MPVCPIHLQREMLAQRIFSLALGYEDVNDQQTLRDDPALQVAAEKPADEESPLASPSTLNRLENRVDRKSLFAMSELPAALRLLWRTLAVRASSACQY